LKQTLNPETDALIHKKLVRQVSYCRDLVCLRCCDKRQIWFGVALGVFISLCIGAGVIGAFYTVGRNSFESAENVWEGVFALVAAIIITIMGAALLRISKLQDKWRVKIAKALEAKDTSPLPLKGRAKRWAEKYAMFLLPFVTVLREGIEAVL
jgi:high-affinity iron transporter